MMILLHLLFLLVATKKAASQSGDGVTGDYDSTDYDCTGSVVGKECRPPSSCETEFEEICPAEGSTCCPEPRFNLTEIVPLGTTTDCKDRKCKVYYGGWWSLSCKPETRSLYFCQSRGTWCCGSPCKPSGRCQRLGGYCVTHTSRCDGAIMKPGCKGKQCHCCLPKADTRPTCPINGNTGESCTGHRSCAEHRAGGATSSGVYTICPISTCNPVLTFCDMTSNGGNWTVFVSRDKTQVDQEDFSRTWDEYKKGFGSCNKEYWLGNEILHNMTNSRPHIMRLDAEDMSGNKKWLQYSIFLVGNEGSQYQLTISGYNSASTLGDILTETSHPLFNLNGIKFSTKDRQNDLWPGGSCSIYYNNGGGFWYNSCSAVTPTNNAGAKCSYWTPGVIAGVALKKIKMSIRPAII